MTSKFLIRSIGSAVLVGALCFPAVVFAQDRDRYDRDDHDRMTRIDPGTSIAVRLNETIDADRDENRTYSGTVDQDVRGENGRLAIPRGSQVMLRVHTARDNDLVLDLQSVNVRGETYSIETDPNRVRSDHDDGLVGSIVGAVTGNDVRGRHIRVHRDTVLNFRIEQPLVWRAHRG